MNLLQPVLAARSWFLAQREVTPWTALAFLLCAAGAVTGLFGQQAGQPGGGAAEPAFTLKVDVNRVLIPVVVRDKAGRVIADLKMEDFEVFANDKPQTVTGFAVERRGQAVDVSPGSPSGTGDATEAVTGTAAGTQQRGGQAPRFVVLLFDDLHLSIQDLVHVQKSGEEMLDGALSDLDLAAVVSASGKTNSGLTRDRGKLLAAIKSLRPQNALRAEGNDCPSIDYYQADQIENRHNSVTLEMAIQMVFNCAPGMNASRDRDMAERLVDAAAARAVAMGHQDVQLTYFAIGEFVRRMGALPGQRTLILVSPGFTQVSPDEYAAESKVLELAARANVTVNAMDARGLYTTNIGASQHIVGSGRTVQLLSDYKRTVSTQNENPMAELAEGTGGAYWHNSNDLTSGFRALTEAPECVYVLEVSPGDAKPDGGYHRLRVKVDREGTRVQARRGYFAAKPEKKTK